jgi:hypothetical protein
MWEQLLDQFNIFFECHVTSYFVQPTLRTLGKELVYGNVLGWGYSQNKGPQMRRYPSLALHFGNVSHPRALHIVKHKAKFIMNQTYIDHEV